MMLHQILWCLAVGAALAALIAGIVAAGTVSGRVRYAEHRRHLAAVAARSAADREAALADLDAAVVDLVRAASAARGPVEVGPVPLRLAPAPVDRGPSGPHIRGHLVATRWGGRP